ncbi:hypothetical protein CROQUDRAFT_662066 [Cronartium quercuum f. sp. fusiforme G11]|uniref:Uncharacterized protein n=1 Tax=Cronartium quercuum f. sp. fusiforme G11 TaxID=708437 RepID=A0A9P6T9R1_9BASI|nr:hypothetical protein CROQUDRAFT_662066 [Cronartium quercuum f. sp. fusiforme G11]
MARSELGRNPDMCVNVERNSNGSKEFQIDMSTDEGMYVDTSLDEDVEDDLQRGVQRENGVSARVTLTTGDNNVQSHFKFDQKVDVEVDKKIDIGTDPNSNSCVDMSADLKDRSANINKVADDGIWLSLLAGVFERRTEFDDYVCASIEFGSHIGRDGSNTSSLNDGNGKSECGDQRTEQYFQM